MLLSAAAGWNQTAADWHRLIALSPDGCFGISIDGTLAATTTVLPYGARLAWIGMVLTHPDFQRRGLATELMGHALQYAQSHRIACLKLDATAMGAPLYEKLGFTPESSIQRWARSPQALPTATPFPPGFDAAMDHAAFGVDRSALLQLLKTEASAIIPGAGFAFGRPGANAAYFGPCVCMEEKAARQLLQWFLNSHQEENVLWDLLPTNQYATRLAQEFGFAPARLLTRMTRGSTPLQSKTEMIYAIAGFECG